MQIGSWNIGRVSTPPKVVTKEVLVKEKGGFFGGFMDWKNKLTTETAISDKLIKANRGWVYRNNDVIAKAVSELEPQLYRMGIKGSDIDFEEIDDHPILDLLDRFNDSMNKSEGFYLTQSHVKLAGDSFWLLTGPQDAPENIFLLQPDKVTIKLGDFTDATATLIEGYKYKDRVQDGGKVKEIEETYQPQQVIHFKVPNPGNMFRGKSTVEALADEIDTDNFATEVQKNFFANGAIVDFVLSTDSKVTAEQRKVLRRELRGYFGGFRNAFKTLILGGGLKPEKLQFSNKEIQLIQLQEWFRDKIMVGFGNTKASLGLVDDVNRATHESSIISWRSNSVRPEMTRLVDTLNEYLVPRYGDNLILGFKDPIPENREGKIKEAVDLKAGDIINQNEAREILGLDAVEGGDEFGRERADRRSEEFAANLPKALKYIDVSRHLRRTGFTHKLARGREIYKASKELATTVVKSRRKEDIPEAKRHEQFTNEQVLDYWNKQITAVEAIEIRLLQRLETFLRELENEMVGNMQEAIATKDVGDDLVDVDDFMVRAQVLFEPLLIEAMVLAGTKAFDLIDVSAPFIMTERLNRYVSKQVNKFTQSMIDTDKEKMKDIIIEGIREGKGVPAIERAMRSEFEDTLIKTQTERITRTEVLRASNQASLQAFEDSGVVVAKQWLTAGADDECAQYEGQVVELREGFYDGGNEFQDGDPPLHPNCKCIVLPIVEGAKSFDAKPVMERRRLQEQITEFEKQIDKRTREFKQVKDQQLEDEQYIKELEKLVYNARETED